MKLESSITIRVTEEEKDELLKQADQWKIKLSKYLRLKLVSTRLPRNTQVVSIDWEKYNQLGEISFQLRKIGTNINQLAHSANLSIQMGDPMDLEFKKLIEISENIEQTEKILTDIRDELKNLLSLNPKND
jgi:hypothetical protein